VCGDDAEITGQKNAMQELRDTKTMRAYLLLYTVEKLHTVYPMKADAQNSQN